MEWITYRITLDAHKTGIQRTLQGFETADKVARRISINLTASGDTYELPMGNVVAMMYVTTPDANEPSINKCTIEGNTITYNAEPIVTEGITEMQIKLIESCPGGAKKVIAYPRFAVEVTQSNTEDEGAEQTTTFTALEDAIAKADAVYNARLLRVEFDNDCIFKAYFADGTVYESNMLKGMYHNGGSILAESFAKGGTGTRNGEDTDNSMYYSNVSRTASEDAKRVSEGARELLEENLAKTSATSFKMDFETGELTYLSHSYAFEINKETGELIMSPDDAYDINDLVENKVDELISAKTEEIDNSLANQNETLEALSIKVVYSKEKERIDLELSKEVG